MSVGERAEEPAVAVATSDNHVLANGCVEGACVIPDGGQDLEEVEPGLVMNYEGRRPQSIRTSLNANGGYPQSGAGGGEPAGLQVFNDSDEFVHAEGFDAVVAGAEKLGTVTVGFIG